MHRGRRNAWTIVKGMDWVICVAILSIMCLGVVNLYSASFVAHSPFYIKQMIWYVVGIFAMIVMFLVDYRRLCLWAGHMYWTVVGLLVLVLVIGRSAGGSQRWLNLYVFNLQPSEFSKLIMIIVFAKYFHDNAKDAYGLRDLIKPLVFAIIPCVLILKQPDLGTALLILMVLSAMVLVARIKRSAFITLLLACAAITPIAWEHLKPYQKRRILTFLDPESDPIHAGYHIIQSKVAVGSGGIWGKGFMHGTQAHLSFLPEVHTDFAFSLWGEEWGLVGAVLLVFLYFMVIYRGLKIAFSTEERMGSYLAFGIAAMFFLQVIVNVNMVLGFLPVVGVPLPLFSYGGSSVIVSMMGMGLLMGVGARRHFFQSR